MAGNRQSLGERIFSKIQILAAAQQWIVFFRYELAIRSLANGLGILKELSEAQVKIFTETFAAHFWESIDMYLDLTLKINYGNSHLKEAIRIAQLPDVSLRHVDEMWVILHTNGKVSFRNFNVTGMAYDFTNPDCKFVKGYSDELFSYRETLFTFVETTAKENPDNTNFSLLPPEIKKIILMYARPNNLKLEVAENEYEWINARVSQFGLFQEKKAGLLAETVNEVDYTKELKP